MSLTDTLAGIVGAAHVVTDPDVLDGRSVDHTGRYRGHASMLVRPGSADEVSAVLHACRDAGAYGTVQGGRTSLVAGTVPEHDDVLELIDARASALTAEHVGVSAPVAGGWQLLIELAGDTTKPSGLPTRSRMLACRVSLRSVSTSARSSGSGRSANRSPRCSACTGRR
jgi:hypothetical protein